MTTSKCKRKQKHQHNKYIK